MAAWLGLLIGCVVSGACLVAALILPRYGAPLAAAVGFLSLFAAITNMGNIAQRYDTPQAIAAALVVLLGGLTAGYAVAAAALPFLARTSPTPRPARGVTGSAATDAVVLMACTDPERYSARVVAYRQNVLSETADVDVPSTAVPFVYFAEKSRYRAAAKSTPGPVIAWRLAEAVAASPPGMTAEVDLAWCHAPETLAATVASQSQSGAANVAVVVLGPSESAYLDEAQRLLDPALKESGAPRVAFGPSVWSDHLLAARLVERIMAVTLGAPPEDVGVVLVNEGTPSAWERRYSAAGATENYFNQRARVLLCDAGLEDSHIRTASLEWQTPDVTEAVRHLAVLGCSRVVVAPSTIALPTLQTMLDLGYAVNLARVPEELQVVTLPPWGEDEGFADAVRRSAAQALEELRNPASPRNR